MNVGGIVGPAIGGLIVPIAGPALLFALNDLAFLFAAVMIARCYREHWRPEPHLENFLESFATSLGLGRTLLGGAILLSASLALAIPPSINFATP